MCIPTEVVQVSSSLTLDLSHPLVSPEEHNDHDLTGETKGRFMGTRISPLKKTMMN